LARSASTIPGVIPGARLVRRSSKSEGSAVSRLSAGLCPASGPPAPSPAYAASMCAAGCNRTTACRRGRRRSRLYPWTRASIRRLERGAPPRISLSLSGKSAKAGRRPALQFCWIGANLSHSEKVRVQSPSPRTGDFEELRNFGMCGKRLVWRVTKRKPSCSENLLVGDANREVQERSDSLAHGTGNAGWT